MERPISWRQRIVTTIEEQIHEAFPNASIDQRGAPRTGKEVFHIWQEGLELRVYVTETTLETEDPHDLEALIALLRTLPNRLKELKSGESLTIQESGIA